MIINANSPLTSFKGRVRMDKNHVQQQINVCPPSTRESIQGNIDTLCDRFKNLASDDKKVEIGFDYKQTDEAYGWYGIGKVLVKGNYQQLSKEFRLCERTSGQEVWDDGFSEITQKALDPNFDVDNDEINKEIDKAFEQYCMWDVSYSDHSITDEERREIFDIADKFKFSPRVNLEDKYGAATLIYFTKRHKYENSDELTRCLVNSVNQAVFKLEEHLPKDKNYALGFRIGTDSCSYNAPGNLMVDLYDDNSKERLHHTSLIYIAGGYYDDRVANTENVRTAFNKFVDESIWQAWN